MGEGRGAHKQWLEPLFAGGYDVALQVENADIRSLILQMKTREEDQRG